MRSKSFNYVAEYQKFEAAKAKKRYATDDTLERDLQPGWLLPYLFPIEDMTWGRWNYWTKIHLEGALPPEPIPEISFIEMGDSQNHGRKMFERCINAVGGGGWSLGSTVEYILDWVLYGFGYTKELPPEPCARASMKLYQLFDLWPLLIWPYDYLGDMMAEAGVGRGQSFYPTPHSLVEMMTKMTMEDGDHRAEKMNDCCCGTGRMLLHASNHCLRLYAQDISLLAVKATNFHGYLYAPWLVKPFEWDENDQIVQTEWARDCARLFRLERLLRAVREIENPVEVVDVLLEEPESAEAGPPDLTLFGADFTVEHTPGQRPVLKRAAKSSSEPVDQLSLLEV